MRKYIAIALWGLIALTSCGEYNKVLKSADAEYRYEAAKSYFAEGANAKAASLLEELVPIMKGTSYGEESIYMLAMTYMNQGDYNSASNYFRTYYNTYPRGEYAEEARFNCGKALYYSAPEYKLDQSSTYAAIKELQLFIEFYPSSARRLQAQDMMFELQDKLVEKEYHSAKLYYDLGSYTGNMSASSSGNNYLAAVVTAQNVLKDYPYTSMKEEISLLILKAKFGLAKESVDERKRERMQEVVDEYYAFQNEYPESKHLKEVNDIFRVAARFVGAEASSVEED